MAPTGVSGLSKQEVAVDQVTLIYPADIGHRG